MQKPFWEQTYQTDDVSVFGTEPNQAIVDYWQAFKQAGTVLDIGCGEGRNAIFLAQKGFVVDAFDISRAGIEKLQRLAAKANVKVNAWVQDLCEYEFTQKYDVITTFGTLHFVTKPEWKKFICKAQKYTSEGGFHVIHIFTNKLPATPDIAPFIKSLADEGELEALYESWNIIESKSYTFEDEHPGIGKHWHASNKIVARKK